ncbi:MAG TPA: TetR family transcriptional regulator [Gemmatimonadales bacterium]
MAGTRDARQRILDAAGELVTMEGVGAATPAAIAERAGAGKMSLYRHFSGKDELVAEALAQRDPAYRVLLLGGPTDLPARDRLLAMFDHAAAVADRLGSSFIGCPFVSARLDLSDGHPAVPVVVAHKDGMLHELAALLTKIGVPDPEQRAQVLLMLLDGAVIHSVIRGNGDPLRDARAALPALLPAP